MLEGGRIEAIPPISLCFITNLSSANSGLSYYFIICEVSLSIFGAHFPRSLCACLRVVGKSTTVRARTLAVLGYHLVSAYTTFVPSVMNGGLCALIAGSLMIEDLGVILFHVPWGLLNVLRHVRQVELLLRFGLL